MAKLEMMGFTPMLRDPRGFGYRVRVTYAQTIGYVFGAPNRDAYIKIEHYTSRDGSAIYKAYAYDNGQYDRWTANVFLHKDGRFNCFATGASPLDLLVHAGIPIKQAENLVAAWVASGPIKPTGTSSFLYETEKLQFVPSATPPAKEQKPDAGDAPVLARIRAALEEYHLALDRREHGSVAAHTLINKLQNELNMPWVQGAALKRAQPVHAQPAVNLVHVYAPPTGIAATGIWWRPPTPDERREQLMKLARSHLR
jgi:hypothetical protein